MRWILRHACAEEFRGELFGLTAAQRPFEEFTGLPALATSEAFGADFRAAIGGNFDDDTLTQLMDSLVLKLKPVPSALPSRRRVAFP